MAKDLNKVMIIGRLGADPELRYTQGGQAICSFRVASGRSWRDAGGNQHEDTEWFRVVAWDKLEETCTQYRTKGSRVYVEGRLQTRKWQDATGQDRHSTEVVAGDMIMLDSRREIGGGTPPQGRIVPTLGFPMRSQATTTCCSPTRGAAPAQTRPPATRHVPGVRKSSAGAVKAFADEDLPF
ncbi:MAG: single-stranded DNA-binding protein [Acidobacteria bacterium]|nr:single-stranded DNA-binding protein [Acidobacteriota bacterium]